MKVFATLATLLGFTYADPNVQSAFATNGLRSYKNDIMRPSSMMSIDHRQMDRPLSMQMSLDRPMMMDRHQMSDKRMSPMMTMTYRDNNNFGPNQYFLRDDFGNYDYGYASQNSERFEEGNGQGSVKGHYAYVDSNGMTRRVDYIADDEGFHILGDNNNDRLKRSVEPDLVRTRMTSYMDASSMRDDGRDMPSRMDNRNMMKSQMLGRQNMYRMMSDNASNRRDMSSGNMMSRNMMMDNNMMSRNMMRDNDMMSRNMMRDNNMMVDNNMMSRNMMMDNNMMSRNMMRDNDMMSRNMYSNRMGDNMGAMVMDRDMMATQNMELMGQDISSNMMLSSYKNGDNLTGDRNSMSQRMAIQRFPELSSRFF